ncbi:APC family permease [Mycoplasma sp. 1654_15]|uniref:APC family permease n=1 Tax=Mycoplasma sp. 1654_15 TaxID=2725994 RepID=UPI00144A1AC9|nr:APC family permease [Mycoplasma sp. 1654_15]QJB71452.1 APC family permease [Mycoplasma sp. 1654_15]
MFKKFFKNKENSNKNHLSERQFLFFGLNYIVGFGFIATISGVILTGSWGMFVFALTSLITLAVLLSFSRAANKYKDLVGSSYAYSKKTFGRSMSFFQGWNQFVQIPLFASTVPLFFSILLTSLDPEREVLYTIISVVLYILLISISTFGVRLSARFIFASAAIKWLTLAVGFGLIVYLIASSKNSFIENISDVSKPFSIVILAKTVLNFIYAYGGFEGLAGISKEVKTNRFKKLLVVLFIIIFSAYFIFYLIFLGLSKSVLIADGKENFGLDLVYKIVWGTTGSILFSIGIFFNRFSATLSSSLYYGRLIAPLAEDGYIPTFLAKKNKNGEYRNAIYTVAVISILSTIIFTIIPKALKVQNSFNSILNSGNSAYLIQYWFTIFTVLVWKWKNAEKIPLWEVIVYIIALLIIPFVLLFSFFPWIAGEEFSKDSIILIFSYFSVILLGYILWGTYSWYKNHKLSKTYKRDYLF